ncbi:MAG: hypothetical protein M1822_008272 [Bathelium mastoideum]|nr:MAG: hypothetical protein M1822_008272 [Bathelium mastoideum]
MYGNSTVWANGNTPGTTFTSTTLATTTVSLAPVPHTPSGNALTTTAHNTATLGETAADTKSYSQSNGNTVSFLTETDTQSVEMADTPSPAGESTSNPTVTLSSSATLMSSNGLGTFPATTVDESQHGPTWTPRPPPVGPVTGSASALSKPTTIATSDSSTSTGLLTSTSSVTSAISRPPSANISSVASVTTRMSKSYCKSNSTSPTSKSSSSTLATIPWRSFTSTLSTSLTSAANASSVSAATVSSNSTGVHTTWNTSLPTSVSQTGIPFGPLTTSLSPITLSAASTLSPITTIYASSANQINASSVSGTGPTAPAEGPSAASQASSIVSSATSKLSSSVSSSLSAIGSSLPLPATTSQPSATNATVTGHSVTSGYHPTYIPTPEPPVQPTGPLPSSCGPVGDFFDDLPAGPLPPNTTNSNDPLDSENEPPVFSPFHDLFFSDGFYYVPPPGDPFRPSSPPQLAVFLPNKTGQPLIHPDIGTLYTGEIGAGPESDSSAFTFNAYSARLGCDWTGNDFCSMAIYGYQYNATTGNQTQVADQYVELPPCHGTGCNLWLTGFAPTFTNITGIRFEAYNSQSQPLKWFMDDFSVGWANNTCAAGQLRENARGSGA